LMWVALFILWCLFSFRHAAVVVGSILEIIF